MTKFQLYLETNSDDVFYSIKQDSLKYTGFIDDFLKKDFGVNVDGGHYTYINPDKYSNKQNEINSANRKALNGVYKKVYVLLLTVIHKFKENGNTFDLKTIPAKQVYLLLYSLYNNDYKELKRYLSKKNIDELNKAVKEVKFKAKVTHLIENLIEKLKGKR